jgi:hypothetical protein
MDHRYQYLLNLITYSNNAVVPPAVVAAAAAAVVPLTPAHQHPYVLRNTTVQQLRRNDRPIDAEQDIIVE